MAVAYSQHAVDLIRIFSYYQLVDKPALREGQTFGKDAEAPRFRMVWEEHPPYEGDVIFGNVFGM